MRRLIAVVGLLALVACSGSSGIAATDYIQTSSAAPTLSPTPSPTPKPSIDPSMADTETCVALSQLKAAMSAVQRSPNSWWPWYQEILRQALASLDPYVHYYKSEQPDRLGVLLQYISAITQAIIQQGLSADHIEVTSMAIRAMGESRQALRCIHDNASMTI